MIILFRLDRLLNAPYFFPLTHMHTRMPEEVIQLKIELAGVVSLMRECAIYILRISKIGHN